VPIVVSFQDRDQKDHTTAIALVGAVLSFGMHLGLYSMLSRTHTEPPVIKKPVDIEIVEKATPPPPKPPEEKKPEPPKPEPVKPKVKLPPPPKLEKPPPPQPPPPSNQPPPPPNAPPPPINIGLSLSSTTQGGAFAAPVGNTLYGKPDEKARPPSEAKPYVAPPGPPPAKFVPSYQVTEPAEPLGGTKKPPYPEEAKKEGLEGQVVLELRIGADGRVLASRVLQGDGHGFNEAALQFAREMRFKPAKMNGEPVETKITYTVTFVLD
jgi:protein TonB